MWVSEPELRAPTKGGNSPGRESGAKPDEDGIPGDGVLEKGIRAWAG